MIYNDINVKGSIRQQEFEIHGLSVFVQGLHLV